MLLAEAQQERSFLKRALEVLGSRLLDDSNGSQSRTLVGEELVSTSNRLRDLEVAIGWTEQQAMVSGLPLAAYEIRGKLLGQLADQFEKIDMKMADNFRQQSHTDKSLAVKATWFVDLQIPPVETDEPEEKE